MSDYETIIASREGRVQVIQLNRPKALNALNAKLIAEVLEVCRSADSDEGVGCILIKGSERAFAAGADISEMADKDYDHIYGVNPFGEWDKIAATRTPMIAAVSGFALGGGCELAMMCDIIMASTTARFGQPEIKLGIIPGAGGTQRLTQAVGKAKAMDLCLTGRMMDAKEAERAGLVARVLEPEALDEEAMKAAATIAGYSKLSTIVAKDAVGRAQDMGVTEGVQAERRLFAGLFATEDQKEGMAAFMEKRPPVWKRDR
ncbi:MAG: putative enoyl-CoA hydratase echA8 [Rhodospirillaceae bacterium]|nr:MAG: putative enoyl-CoA hydratase echA8 [Rhodospirillaceae bacterium]